MRRVASLILCSLILDCGGGAGPAAPTPPGSLTLQPGRQVLSVGGFGLSEDPRYPPCVPIRVPYDGTSVDTIVRLQREGGDWVARSASPDLGDLELRFRDTPSGLLQVSGTVRGTALDAGATPSGIVHDVRVSFPGAPSGDAIVEGELASPLSSMLNGRIAGLVRFSDSQGNASTCSAVMWSLQPERQP